VPRAGVEPARPFGLWILSPQRLPFRHPGICQLSLALSLHIEERIPPSSQVGKQIHSNLRAPAEDGRSVQEKQRCAIWLT
jgi:hypothetical protein